MQTLEAMISLLFFMWAASSLLSSSEPEKIDDSLYRMQLAEDAWRVLYLRGDLQDLSDMRALEPALERIREETGLCIFVDGIACTSCRGGNDEHEIMVLVRRTIICKGHPESVSLSLGTDVVS